MVEKFFTVGPVNLGGVNYVSRGLFSDGRIYSRGGAFVQCGVSFLVGGASSGGEK